MPRVFSYGTLRLPEVQRATFGRLLDGHEDAVVGYRLEVVTVTDEAVLAASGTAEHPILVRADDSDAAIPGTVFEISDDELLAADEYEVDDYERVEVPLRSGGSAWVYVAGRATP